MSAANERAAGNTTAVDSGKSQTHGKGLKRARCAARPMGTTSARAIRVASLRAQGITDEAVLRAFLEVPREQFVLAAHIPWAYRDIELPAGDGRSVAAPTLLARILEAAHLSPTDTTLLVGSGTGYAAALMSKLVDKVFAVERDGRRARLSQSRLRHLQCNNVAVGHGDGSRGWPEHGPYDAIVVLAAAPGIPASLWAQLKPGGRMLIAAGPTPSDQRLMRVTKSGESSGLSVDVIDRVRLSALVGAEAWGNRRIR